MTKINKKKVDFFDFSNPFAIYGSLLIILGIVLGGAIGAGLGFLLG